MARILENVLCSIGVAAIGYVFYQFLDFGWIFIKPSQLPKYLRKDGPSWALITGASDGIGKGMAHEFAAKGFDVIIHGRNEAKLQGVVDELKKEYPKRNFRIAVADAQSGDSAGAAAKVVAAVKDLPVVVLANNAGGTGRVNPLWSKLQDRTSDEIDATIDLNLRFVTHMTSQMIPILAKSPRGLILFSGSQSDWAAVPWNIIYAGCKVYHRQFSYCLRHELKTDKLNIDVLHIAIGRVQASGAGHAEVGLFIPTSRVMAKSIIDRIGCDKASIAAYFPHTIQAMAYYLPAALTEGIAVSICQQEMATEEERRKRSL